LLPTCQQSLPFVKTLSTGGSIEVNVSALQQSFICSHIKALVPKRVCSGESARMYLCLIYSNTILVI
jgi:hypothetical protein